jgi:hypothetical protein
VNVKVNRALLALSLLLLLVIAWLGLRGGISDWSQIETPGQRIQTVAQIAYGFLALLVVLSVWKPAFARVIRAGWLICIAIAGGFAPVVWGDSSLASGVVAGFGTVGIGLLILWLLDVGTRGLTHANNLQIDK